ncbi:MAG TPA: hypothetical protein VLU94_02725 [Candidatus Nitrosotalea sp.]|nr:hypothetical protein [Candidatus Nitrosotalea sp.]
MKLTFALQIAGLLHFGLIVAGALMPRAVNLRANLAVLPPFIRRLFWVYYTFIGLSLVGFGGLSFFLADTLASGTTLARAVCGFLVVFWTLRLIVAVFIFDVKPYLTSAFWKAGYHATNVVFALLPVIYGWAALAGGVV